MKKLIVAVAAVAVAGVASADIYANLSAGTGIYSGIGFEGIVAPVQGTEIVLQVIGGGGDGVQGAAVWDGATFVLGGNDVLLGTITSAVSADPGTDFSDYAATLSGVITAADTPDTWIRVSGIEAGNRVYEQALSFASLDSSDPLVLPESLFFDNGGLGGTSDGTILVEVVPEPATIGLMGIAGLGMFLARRKTHA